MLDSLKVNSVEPTFSGKVSILGSVLQ
jgi:hypothetical protein